MVSTVGRGTKFSRGNVGGTLDLLTADTVAITSPATSSTEPSATRLTVQVRNMIMMDNKT